MTLRQTLFIYREEFPDPSEPFILSQGESMKRSLPVYIGLRRVPGLNTPEKRTIVLAAGRFERFRAARLKLFGATRSTIKSLSELRPTLLHAHFGMDAVQAMPLAHALRVPLVVTFHGWDATVRDDVFRNQSIALNLYVRRRADLNRAASRIICVSEFIREIVVARGFTPDKTIVHYIGIDLNKFVPDPSVKRHPVVLFVGRLVEKKGCEYLIQAMERVQKNIEGAELVVIGDGPLRRRLELEAAARLRAFRFLGACGPEVVREWMNKASVFSTPSVVARSGDAEGFGMVFAEAQAMGLPVASFASGGIPEAVEHGVTGMLAPERDVDALANNILMLLTNQAMWQRFSDAGQERVKRLFDLHKQTAKLEAIYQEVIEEKRAHASYAVAH